jgi:hypothetical protein
MAFVFGVIAAATWSRSRLKVRGSMSTNTGLAPHISTVEAVATKVKGVVMTSSPGPRPIARRAISSASVPEAQEIRA